jgi:hypothetical protein
MLRGKHFRAGSISSTRHPEPMGERSDRIVSTVLCSWLTSVRAEAKIPRPSSQDKKRKRSLRTKAILIMRICVRGEAVVVVREASKVFRFQDKGNLNTFLWSCQTCQR